MGNWPKNVFVAYVVGPDDDTRDDARMESAAQQLFDLKDELKFDPWPMEGAWPESAQAVEVVYCTENGCCATFNTRWDAPTEWFEALRAKYPLLKLHLITHFI